MSVIVYDPSLQEVHARAADETRDEPVHRFLVELEGSGDLLYLAVFHHGDAVAHGHGFYLVVGDVDNGRFETVMQLADFRPHLHAQLGIQVRKRFVEEKNLGFSHDGAAHRHALPFTAGECFRFACEEVSDAQDASGLVDPRLDLGAGILSQLEPEGHVLVYRHMGIQRVVLEHHGDVPVLRRDVIHAFSINMNLAGRHFFQTGDHSKRCGLAAAGGADKHDELPVLDFQVDVTDYRVLVEPLFHVLQDHIRHAGIPPGTCRYVCGTPILCGK